MSHTSRAWTRPVGALLALVLSAAALAGCGGSASHRASPTPSSSAPSTPSASATSDAAAACASASASVLTSVQHYVDAYGAPLPGASASASPSASPSSSSSASPSGGTGGDSTDLQATLTAARNTLQANGCDQAAFRSSVSAGLQRITANGPLAHAVLLRLTASLTGTLGSSAQTVAAKPGDDLAALVSRLAPNSTVRLAPGRYQLRGVLVLLSGITLSGAGAARTTLTSAAGGSAVLVLTAERVELRALTLLHQGRRPASVLVGGPSSEIVITDATVTGGRGTGNPQQQTGSGISMSAPTGGTPASPHGTTLQVTGSHIAGNQAAGVLLSGAHRASIRGSTIDQNVQCGICFSGNSGGAVRRTDLTGNGVGLAILGQAAPTLYAVIIRGGQVGVQVSGTAAPRFDGLRLVRTARAGMIYTQQSNGRADFVTCLNLPYGIVVGPKAYPYVGQVSCQLAKGTQ